jgi:hypothetical protein
MHRGVDVVILSGNSGVLVAVTLTLEMTSVQILTAMGVAPIVQIPLTVLVARHSVNQRKLAFNIFAREE